MRRAGPAHAQPPPPRTVRINDRVEDLVYGGVRYDPPPVPVWGDGDDEDELDDGYDDDDDDDGYDGEFIPLGGWTRR
ncbi:hypothetical protein AB0D54_13035 [Streptomyces xanthophaeus]|uniref:hypothetical protein n=1 Tax=Streptomyces xanthophaeus TaxID=67385 RepID=UPI0034274A2A